MEDKGAGEEGMVFFVRQLWKHLLVRDMSRVQGVSPEWYLFWIIVISLHLYI